MKKHVKLYRWLWNLAGRTKGMVVLLALFEIANGAVGVGFALMLRRIINAAVGQNAASFWDGVIFLCGIVLTRILLRAAIRFTEERAIARLDNQCKQRIFTLLLEKEYAAVSAVHSGEWMNRLTADVAQVTTNLVRIVPNVCGMVFKLLFALVVLLLLEPRFLFFVLPGGFLILLGSFLVRPYLVFLHKKVQEKNGRLRVYLQEILGNIMTTRAFLVQDSVLGEAKEHLAAHYRARIRQNTFSVTITSIFSILIQSVYILAVIFCGSGILHSTIGYGDFVAVIQLIGQVQSPFANLSGISSRFYAMLASAERLMETEEMPSDDIIPLPGEEVAQKYGKDFQKLGFRDVFFTYRAPLLNFGETLQNEEETTVFENLNLEIQKGEYVALTGDSGCGKSTVLKLLLTLYKPDKGQCFVNFGTDEELTAKWQRLFSYVPQGDCFMSGTIRETVAFFDKEKMQDTEALSNALRIACADTFVDALENGVDTVLGENGQGLSGGQIQRLSIARAVFSGRPILMLDECTSALDAKTEAKVLENLRTMTDKTVLIVTHRPAALSICDKVMEFKSDGIHVQNLRDRK